MHQFGMGKFIHSTNIHKVSNMSRALRIQTNKFLTSCNLHSTSRRHSKLINKELYHNKDLGSYSEWAGKSLLECKLHEGRNFYLFCSLLCPHGLEWYLDYVCWTENLEGFELTWFGLHFLKSHSVENRHLRSTVGATRPVRGCCSIPSKSWSWLSTRC